MQTARVKDGIKALKGKNWEEFYYTLKPAVVSLFISIMMPIMFPPDADVSFNVAVTKLLLIYLMYGSLLLFVVKAVKLVVRIIYRGKVFADKEVLILSCIDGCTHEVTFSGRGLITVTTKLSPKQLAVESRPTGAGTEQASVM